MIGISPFTPTSLDRNQERRNPREPKLDKDGKPVEAERDEKLDAVEDAVPPLAPNK